jgi:hypothetical protein
MAMDVFDVLLVTYQLVEMIVTQLLLHHYYSSCNNLLYLTKCSYLQSLQAIHKKMN